MELGQIIMRFGKETRWRLLNVAITGTPEDQLRAPSERLFRDQCWLAFAFVTVDRRE